MWTFHRIRGSFEIVKQLSDVRRASTTTTAVNLESTSISGNSLIESDHAVSLPKRDQRKSSHNMEAKIRRGRDAVLIKRTEEQEAEVVK